MATSGSVSIIGSTVNEPPLPGDRNPVEFVTACFTACGASVASGSYSFQTSFGGAPSLVGHGAPVGSQNACVGAVQVSSLNANGASFFMYARDGANSSFNHTTTFMFVE